MASGVKSIMGRHALRPLKRGEYRQNKDGSRSSELSLTEKIDGRWTNIPSLWMSGSRIVELAPDDAIQAARRWEKTTGKSFPQFPSLKAAVVAAKRRSDAGGAMEGK
jgi:hypothetical protein